MASDNLGNISGLSGKEVEELKAKGFVNKAGKIKTKSVAEIVRDNTCTLFNLINVVLAIMVAVVGSYKNMLFMGIIICNVGIGIFQEIRAKSVIDKLAIMTAPKSHAIRDGIECEVATDELVLGDIIILKRGDQVCADSEVTEGECYVNESLLTGESEPQLKRKGSALLSGSFITSGRAYARIIHVGAENYSYKIMQQAKTMPNVNSEMMKAIRTIIRIVSVCIIPLSAILFYRQINNVGQNFDEAVVSTVAAIISMIPEGLVLLTSAVLAVSVIRLSREQTLVQELFCIETLARVNMLCLDKTGTITEGKLVLRETLDNTYIKMPDSLKGINKDSLIKYFADCFKDTNPTTEAIREYYGAIDTDCINRRILECEEFSSEKKRSAVSLEKFGTLYLGAADKLLKDKDFEELSRKADEYAEAGYRVLALLYNKNEKIKNDEYTSKEYYPLCLFVIEDKIRDDAEETLRFFAEQGVKIKVISGDNPATVASVAKRAGLSGADDYIDAGVLKTEKDIEKAAEKYTVFGRVTPQQKLQLVKAFKKMKYTVGMTGDGVNDVLALKEADCSVAMRSGSDAARNVSKLVLLDSNFSAMPKVVAEGRRSINNLERSAALFLEKTVYAFILAVIFAFISEPYPFMPIQMTLINALTIGIPSFLLALEPNYEVVKGRFFKNVMRKSIPGGILVVANVISCIYVGKSLGLNDGMISTVCVVMTSAVSFMVLFRLCIPFNVFRGIMYLGLVAVFCIAFLFFDGFFQFERINKDMGIMIIVQSVISALVLPLFAGIVERLFGKE